MLSLYHCIEVLWLQYFRNLVIAMAFLQGGRVSARLQKDSSTFVTQRQGALGAWRNLHDHLWYRHPVLPVWWPSLSYPGTCLQPYWFARYFAIFGFIYIQVYFDENDCALNCVASGWQLSLRTIHWCQLILSRFKLKTPVTKSWNLQNSTLQDNNESNISISRDC